MADGAALKFPEISDASVTWACSILGLPPTAFSGADGLDARLLVLKSMESADIEACPGSGKTTLLVAKLAILANGWTDRRRGLCVLSHTNVARREIEQKLGSTAAGQKLLKYPHFIGTIHGFVNEFLGLPWLRSKGYPVEVIDDEITLRRRWSQLPFAIRTGLDRNHHDAGRLRIRDSSFDLGELRWSSGILGKDSRTYLAMQEVCRQSVQEGYFCHDEMFVWANELLDHMPDVTSFLRTRFPLLFIDEVQDNSERQSRLLHRIFVDGENAVCRQRYGDSNQAIYQGMSQTDGAVTDAFPQLTAQKDIPNSHRFSQDIADFANPLAVVPQGLRGQRDNAREGSTNTTGKHAIFLFDDTTIGFVLPNYAAYLVEVFSEREREDGTFVAIGAVHSPTGDDHIPRHVGHYWQGYDYERGSSEPHPRTFLQHVHTGSRLSQRSGESREAIESIAEAVIRLARIGSPDFRPGNRKRKHGFLLGLLNGAPAEKADYLDLQLKLAIDRMPLTQGEWNGKWRPAVNAIAQAICGEAVDGAEVDRFLAWSEVPVSSPNGGVLGEADNHFHHPDDNPSVAVRVGSIHSAKGETHTATLVLETYYKAHHLNALKKWLTGENSGGASKTDAIRSRLRLHYVAMTRPTHLLCLAMKAESFTVAEIEKLKKRGWRLAQASADGPQWLDAADASVDEA